MDEGSTDRSDPQPSHPHQTRPTDDAGVLGWLSRVGAELTREHDPERLVGRVTDELTAMVGAQFGAFFYNVVDASGESYTLYTISGVPREAFSRFPMPRNTQIFAPTFEGRGIVRLADVTKDPRYGHNKPYAGMPQGHLPVRSYLAAPVMGLDGKVLGGLFFGHAEPGRFDELTERALAAVVPLASAALENARLFTRLAERERALASSERRYRLVAEAMQEGVWYWDVATNAVEWSDQLLAMMGVSRDAWPGTFEGWAERLHPDDRARMEAAVRAHLEHRVPYRIELFRLRHEDGGYRWCTTAGQAEWDANGKPLCMAGSFRDVTDRKLAEDRLRASELRYAQMLDSVQDLIFTKNDRGEVTWMNAATRSFLGPKAVELSPASSDERRTHDAADDRLVFGEGRVIERHDEPFIAASGETRVLHTVKAPIRDRDGRVVELIEVARDVTAKKREADAQRLLAGATAILQASLEYESTLANVARSTVPTFADWAAVDMVEPDGELRRVAVHHPDPAKVALAHELHRRYPPDPDAAAGVANVLRTGKVEWTADIPDALLVAGTKDEEHLAIARSLGLRSYIVAPLLVAERPVGAISFVSAESGRRYTDADVAFAAELARRASVAVENASLYRTVQELAASLERRVEERTAALTEANHELESFSYSVSHDLRAPVRHIAGFVDLLRARAGEHLDDQSSRYLDTIRGSATRMGELIDGLLSFSRLGRAALTPRPVDLQRLVEDVVREAEPDLAGREVVWDVGPLPSVTADPTMMRLVVVNLVQNAIKYTRGRAPAHVRVEASIDGNEQVISFRDDGVGFKPEYAHKLFGVFQRLHSDREFEGTGIGLATVRRIIQRHGGRAWAESAGAAGATFHVSLPLLPARGEETTT